MNRSTRGLIWGVAAGLGALMTGASTTAVQAASDRTQDGRNDDGAARGSPVTVKINHEAYAMLRCYVEAVPGELTLLGVARADAENNEILVDRFLLPEQRSSAAHTEVSEEGLARLLVEAVQAGIDTAQLKVWCHSHGEMDVFFSHTDQRNMDTAFPQADWVLSIVINHKGRIKARLCLHRPFRLELDDLPVSIGLPYGIEASIRQEISRKVQQGYDRALGSSQAAGRQQTGGGRGNGQSGYAREAGAGGGRSSSQHVGDD
jgi:proteasome lid subunit RPN8/RPN11